MARGDPWDRVYSRRPDLGGHFLQRSAGVKRDVVTPFPLRAGNLADAALEIALSEFTGIIHIGGVDYLSRYEIAICTANHFGLNNGLIKPITTKKLGQTAKRPLKGGLKVDKAMKLLKTRLLVLDEALKLMDNCLI